MYPVYILRRTAFCKRTSGIHHVLARAIKDTFNRYKTMRGFEVKRKAGWDTHGLPVELGVEELGITKKDIDNKSSDKYISVEDYNQRCRKNVMKFTAEWRELTEKMGYFVDLDNPYITYDNKYIETLWWLLKQLYNKRPAIQRIYDTALFSCGWHRFVKP